MGVVFGCRESELGLDLLHQANLAQLVPASLAILGVGWLGAGGLSPYHKPKATCCCGIGSNEVRPDS